MTKRMRRVAALLTCGLVLASGTSVYAETITSKLGDNTYISLEVTEGQIWARTIASNSKTRVGGLRYPSSGSPSQLIDMGTVWGTDIAHLPAPSGWSIAKGNSYHLHGGFTATLHGAP